MYMYMYMYMYILGVQNIVFLYHFSYSNSLEKERWGTIGVRWKKFRGSKVGVQNVCHKQDSDWHASTEDASKGKVSKKKTFFFSNMSFTE